MEPRQVVRGEAPEQVHLRAVADFKLVGDPTQRPFQAHRPDLRRRPVAVRAGAEGADGEDDAVGRVLTEGDRSFHPMLLVGTSTERGEFFSHAEDEFVHVIEGTISIDFDDGVPRTLGTGDSIYFVGGTRHRWWAVDTIGYRVLVVKERPQSL